MILPTRTMIAGLSLLVSVALGCSDDDDLTGPIPEGRTVYGVDASNTLIVFGSENSATASDEFDVSGLGAGETIVGIDFGPADNRLYAVTGSAIYVVDTLSGAATRVGSAPLSPALSGTQFGIDFNPVPNRIRVHSDNGQNLRLNQETGAVAAVDTALMFMAGDPNAGTAPNLVGTAYTNSVSPAPTTTQLYAIDSDLDVLVLLPSPNSGQITTVGALGVNTSDQVGFDILGSDGTAYAALTSGGNTQLYTINLSTGTATLVDDIDNGSPLIGIAVAR